MTKELNSAMGLLGDNLYRINTIIHDAEHEAVENFLFLKNMLKVLLYQFLVNLSS